MPLRVTIEIVPYGDEARKEKLAEIEITNNLKGTTENGNYDVVAKLKCVFKDWKEVKVSNIKGIERGDCLHTAIECLKKVLRKKKDEKIF